MQRRAPARRARVPVPALTTAASEQESSRWWRWLLLAALVIVLDLATKAWVTAVFREGQELAVTSYMSLVLAYNTGAAFSFLAGAAGWQRWFFAAIAVAASVFIVILLRRGGSRIFCLGLALILGGALGNLWDRVTIGRVTDFLLFHYQGWSWPAFNVADSAITVGAVLLIVDSFRAHPRAAASAAREDRP